MQPEVKVGTTMNWEEIHYPSLPAMNTKLSLSLRASEGQQNNVYS